MNMKQRHKHADAIIAWANGEEIEYSFDGSEWFRASTPQWDENTEYRIKPPAGKYRVALFKSSTSTYTSTADTPEDATFYADNELFVRWLTPWIEYEE